MSRMEIVQSEVSASRFGVWRCCVALGIVMASRIGNSTNSMLTSDIAQSGLNQIFSLLQLRSNTLCEILCYFGSEISKKYNGEAGPYCFSLIVDRWCGQGAAVSGRGPAIVFIL